VTAFQKKFLLFKRQLSGKILDSFPTLKLFCTGTDEYQNLDLNRYISYLDTLLEEFKTRFSDLDSLCEDFSLFVSPYSADPSSSKFSANLAAELIDLQCNSILEKEEKRVSIADFWAIVAKTKKFPLLCKFVAKILSIFTTTYLCETSFSLMKFIKSRHRCRLSDEHLSCTLRIMASEKLSPNISKIVERKKRCQISPHSNVI